MSVSKPRKPRPNLFYLLLMIVSTVFLVTVMGYLMSPFVQRQAIAQPGAGPSQGSLSLARWLDRKGELLLAIEFTLMFLLAVLAMAMDRHFSGDLPS